MIKIKIIALIDNLLLEIILTEVSTVVLAVTGANGVVGEGSIVLLDLFILFLAAAVLDYVVHCFVEFI